MKRNREEYNARWSTFTEFLSKFALLWKVKHKAKICVALIEDNGDLYVGGNVSVSPATLRKMAGELQNRADQLSEYAGYSNQSTENGDREKL